jgi:plastocyanin
MTDRLAEAQPLGRVVALSNSGTTIGPAVPGPPLWMCPIITVPTFVSLMLKQIWRLLPFSVTRAEPLPSAAWGTSALPLSVACSVVAAPATPPVPSVKLAAPTRAAATIDLRMLTISLSSRPVGTRPPPGHYATLAAVVRSSRRPGAYTHSMRALLITAVCLAAAGCGDAPKPAAKAGGEPAIVRVDMKGNRFAPRRIVVRLGQTVRWTNRDAVAHTVAAQKLKLSSEAIRSGQTFGYRPRRAGTFPYYCTIHAGQTGVLVVRGP